LISRITLASVAIKSGSFFALAKKVTLFMVNWKHWLAYFPHLGQRPRPPGGAKFIELTSPETLLPAILLCLPPDIGLISCITSFCSTELNFKNSLANLFAFSDIIIPLI